MAKRMREKAKAREERRDTRPSATAKYIRISPSKARVVMDVVRGRSVPEAIAILENTPKAACAPLVKLINSAAANAENGKGLTKDELYVAEIRADAGPIYKRYQPVSKGRAHSIMKRTSHLTVVLDKKEEA
ncbi:MAG TPA: 50S ribosomal protein L22 [Firmicutes bacterium]|nr:50S ribosomal protein L22 [Bacillota bacterium]